MNFTARCTHGTASGNPYGFSFSVLHPFLIALDEEKEGKFVFIHFLHLWLVYLASL